MSDLIDRVQEKIEQISLEVVTMESKDISAMGKILNILCELEHDAEEMGHPDFSELIKGLRIYLEQLIMGENNDFEPFEQGVETLQVIHRCLFNQEEWKGDISTILNTLVLNQSNLEQKGLSSNQNHKSNEDITKSKNSTGKESIIENKDYAELENRNEIKKSTPSQDQDLSKIQMILTA